jgi:hypothetical protein
VNFSGCNFYNNTDLNVGIPLATIFEEVSTFGAAYSIQFSYSTFSNNTS